MFTGSLVALITPMKPSGQVDWDALANLVEWQIEQKTNGIVAVGTTGESSTLSNDEHLRVISFIVKQTNNRIPVIAGTGQNSTAETLHLTKEAKEIGADAALLVVPYYNRPTQAGLYQHFKLVAEQVALPQILYNIPIRTGSDMLPPLVEKLAKLPNIVGIKEVSDDRSRWPLYSSWHDFALFSGNDGEAMDLMRAGGSGVISVVANIAPRLMQDLCIAIAEQSENVDELNAMVAVLDQAMSLESNPIGAKWALWKMGKIDQGIRLPMTWLDAKYHQQVAEALRKAKIL